MADTNTRQGKRTPVTLKIKFKSETLEQFIERYAVDVSQGGIFIRTKEPLAVGTQMKFEFQLRDASPLIAGEGTVVWTRENDPSRPAIAPGMGVRFDRLADGSQTVLERILAEKAKQAPGRSGSVTAPGDAAKAAAAFTDTPTRVAPASVMAEALGNSDQTPLPKPTPFQSDAEDFDEKAFEEATKVRSLEELAAASAALEGQMDDVANQTKIMPADELAVRRQAGRADSTLADPPLSAPPEDAEIDASDDDITGSTKAAPDRESAPVLPSPPPVAPARSRTPTPAGAPPAPAQKPRTSSASMAPLDVPAAGGGRTQLGVEPAKVPSSSPRIAPPAAEPAAVPRSVAAEPSRPVAPPEPSRAPLIAGLVIAAAAAAGAVWYFALRDKGAASSNDVAGETGGSGSSVATPTPNTGGGGSPTATTGSGSQTDSGSAVAMTGSAGSASDVGSAGSAAVAPAAPTVETTIASATKGATIEIVGTDQKGPAPLTAKLEKGKAYKARISAPGFAVSEIDVTGGEKASTKLVAKPRVITIASEPAGASILVDGVDTGKVTPVDLELTAAQATRTRWRVSLRKAGFKLSDQVLEAAAFAEGDGSLTASIDAKLTQQAVNVRPPTNTGGTGGTTTNTGSGTGSATTTTPPTTTGSASEPTGTGSASTGTSSPTPTPTTGTGAGSAATTPKTTPTTTPTPPATTTPPSTPTTPSSGLSGSTGSGGMSSELK